MTARFRNIAAAAALGGAAAFSASAPVAAADTVELGLIDIYSGGSAFVAEQIRAGFEVALEEANAAGGVDGKNFSLVSADMGGSVEKAVTEARRMMLEQGIRYITIGIHSGAAVAVGKIAEEEKALVVGGFATTKRLTGEDGHRYVARANLSTVEIGRVIAQYLADRPDVKTVATIAPDYEYGQHFVADFLAHLKTVRPDIEVVREEWPKFGAADFAPHVTALQARPVDMIVAGVFGGDLIKFLTAGRDFGLFEGGTQLFAHALDLGKLGSMVDVMPEGAVGTLWYPFYALDTERSKSFEAAIREKTGTYPTGSAPVGYVAGRMITEAIMKAGGAEDVDAVIDALGTVSFEGPTGPVEIRACDGMALYEFFVGTVARGDQYPDGLGVTDLETYDVRDIARSCEEIESVRTN